VLLPKRYFLYFMF